MEKRRGNFQFPGLFPLREKRGQVTTVKIIIGVIVGIIIVIGAWTLLYGGVKLIAGEQVPREEQSAIGSFGDLLTNINRLLDDSDLFVTDSFTLNLPEGYIIEGYGGSPSNRPGCSKTSCICLLKGIEIKQCFPFDKEIKFLSKEGFSIGAKIRESSISDMWIENNKYVGLLLSSDRSYTKTVYLEKYTPFTNQKLNYIYLINVSSRTKVRLNLTEKRKKSGMVQHGGEMSFDTYLALIKNQKDLTEVLYRFWSVTKFYPKKQIDVQAAKKMINVTDELIFSTPGLEDYQKNTIETFFGVIELDTSFSPEIKGRTLISKAKYFFKQGNEKKALEILNDTRRDYAGVSFEGELLEAEAVFSEARFYSNKLFRFSTQLNIKGPDMERYDKAIKLYEEYEQKWNTTGKHIYEVYNDLAEVYSRVKKDEAKANDYLAKIPAEILQKIQIEESEKGLAG